MFSVARQGPDQGVASRAEAERLADVEGAGPRGWMRFGVMGSHWEIKGRGVSGFSDLQVALETAPTPGRIGGRGSLVGGVRLLE